jgi:hypothetical protein
MIQLESRSRFLEVDGGVGIAELHARCILMNTIDVRIPISGVLALVLPHRPFEAQRRSKMSLKASVDSP